MQNVFFRPLAGRMGDNEVVLEAIEPGLIGIDYVGVQPAATKR